MTDVSNGSTQESAVLTIKCVPTVGLCLGEQRLNALCSVVKYRKLEDGNCGATNWIC